MGASSTPLAPEPPARGGKMPSIEAARALAALAVVLMHAANLMRVDHFSGHVGMGNIFDFGYVGVDFFFALSGFIITYVHFNDIGRPGRLLRYLKRRFSRIYPIYWVNLALAVGISLFGRLALGKGWALDLTLADLPGTVFLLMGLGDPKYVEVAWSLQFEIVFYATFCLLLLHARFGAWVFGAWFMFLLARVLGLAIDLPVGLGSAHCVQFLLGVAVGVLARRHRFNGSVLACVGAVAAFAVAVVFEVYGPLGRHSPGGRVVLGLASAGVLLALVAREQQRTIQVPDWLVRMGSVSYSIYLGHIIILNLTYMVLLKAGLYHALPEPLVYATAVGTALIVTHLVGLFIELPLVERLKDGAHPARGAQLPLVPER